MFQKTIPHFQKDLKRFLKVIDCTQQLQVLENVMGFEKALGAVEVIKDQIQYRSQSLLNLARGYFSCSSDNKEKLSKNIRSEYASDFCDDKKSAFRLRLHYAICRLQFYSNFLIRTMIYREFKRIGLTNRTV